MARRSRILGGFVVAVHCAVLTGCLSGPSASNPSSSWTDSPPFTLGAEPNPPRLARSQVPDTTSGSTTNGGAPAGSGTTGSGTTGGGTTGGGTTNDASRAGALLPVPDERLLPSGNPVLGSAAPVLTPDQAAALIQGSKLKVKVTAWVNGRPIFEDELLRAMPPVGDLKQMPEPQRTEKIMELRKMVLEHLIDQEVVYQDAVKMLQKFNPKALAKLKQENDQDFDKRIKKMREMGVSEDELREIGPIARRLLERESVAMQYARSRVQGDVQHQVTLEAVQEYYELHKNEFNTVDKVFWQDVFIGVGVKHATLADARRFAEQLLAGFRADGDFAKVRLHDDGDSKFRNGDGFGNLRGGIRPAELEPYLFALKDGEVGPLVELPTGVHIFRLVKREYAGTVPMTDQVQKQIRRKLENQIAEREFKQLIREIRTRAVVQVIRDMP